MDLSITENLLGKMFLAIYRLHVHMYFDFFFFENTPILLHLNLIGNTILVCIFIKCVLIPF